MSPIIDEQQEEWVGVRKASEIMGCSMYAIQKYAIAGKVRAKLRPPFRTVYSRSDVEEIARSFNVA
jgi:hypothetical protein